MTIETPILIYVPGLGSSSENTADMVADVIAMSVDLRDRSKKYTAETSSEVVTPTGLTVSKTVLDADRSPVLQLFQFNYRVALEESTTAFAPSVGPGALRAGYLALLGGWKWWGALKRPAKTARTKVQLGAGLAAAGALMLAALVAIVALLTTLGLQAGWLDEAFGAEEEVAAWTLGISALGLTITWASLRKKILAFAVLTEGLIRFVQNEDALADTITKRLDAAINDLTDGGWSGPIHLLGYSFGSLVVYEAMFPRTNALMGDVPARSVESIVTIGCPLDMVRLFAPDYVSGRGERRPGLKWTNVFNEADVFASNLKDRDDKSSGPASALSATTCAPVSRRYLTEEIALGRLLTSGQIHAGYWGAPNRANCFDVLVGHWVPVDATTAPVAAPN